MFKKSANHGKNDPVSRRVKIELAGESKLVPVCAWCNSIRDLHGQWHHSEIEPRLHHDYNFTHTICDSCKNEYAKQISPLFSPAPTLS
jgi:hypothetical protein